jgi:hypothetical protein
MAQSQEQDLWAEALRTLPEEERSKYDGLVNHGSGCLEVLQDLLAVTNERKEECIKKRWKVSIKGRTIILSDLLEKVAVWVNKFVAVGDTAVQYDPGHAALPWVAIRFILKVVESLARTLTRCTVTETLYLCSSFKISDRLRGALVSLYASILTFLA